MENITWKFCLYTITISEHKVEGRLIKINWSVKEKKLYTFFNVVDVGQFEVNGGTFETWEILKQQKRLVGALTYRTIILVLTFTILNWQNILSKYAFVNK